SLLRSLGQVLVVGRRARRMAEHEFAHLPGPERPVVLPDDAELDPCDTGAAHRADPARVVQQNAWRVDHPEPLDDPDAEPPLELFPPVWRAAGRKHYPDLMVPVTRPRRLLQQDRDHPAERVELHGRIASAVVPEPGGAEPRGEGELGVQDHRPDRQARPRPAVQRLPVLGRLPTLY